MTGFTPADFVPQKPAQVRWVKYVERPPTRNQQYLVKLGLDGVEFRGFYSNRGLWHYVNQRSTDTEPYDGVIPDTLRIWYMIPD